MQTKLPHNFPGYKSCVLSPECESFNSSVQDLCMQAIWSADTNANSQGPQETEEVDPMALQAADLLLPMFPLCGINLAKNIEL